MLQALVDMVTEFEGNSRLVQILNTILLKIQQKLQDLKTASLSKYKQTVEALMDLLTAVIEAITLAQKRN